MSETKALQATMHLLWEADTAKEMGLGLTGYYTEVEVVFTMDQLETMLQNEDSEFDFQEFTEMENPDDGSEYEHMILVLALEGKGNLPAGLEVCSQMGIPSAIHYLFGHWIEIEETEEE